MEICKKESCTGCGACAYQCPRDCIKMEEDELGSIYPLVDNAGCINCGKCKRVCPVINPPRFNSSAKAYAAWSTDPDERSTSASGGVGAELYSYALEKNMCIAGARVAADLSVEMDICDTRTQSREFKNSKYVFSRPYSLYPQLKERLSKGQEVLVIGLPCQIAAVKALFPNEDKLYLADVVCHGVTPLSYLRRHIAALEKETGKKAAKMYFRDPKMGTDSYTFTLYDRDGDCFYSGRTKDGDVYQVGYHRSITFRENCFHCKFARSERISDLTLGDYKGLGTAAPWDKETKSVSCVLVNSRRGEGMIHELISKNRLVAYERPVCEPVNADSQLQRPFVKSRARKDFERLIRKNNADFEKTMKAVLLRKRRWDSAGRALKPLKKLAHALKRVMKHR